MKVYTIEITPKETLEFYDLRNARKESLKLAKETNSEVFLSCLDNSNYKLDLYTAYPDGSFVTDMKGFRADN